MNKKHILALLILFASWMAFVCYISFSSESIITMIIKKVIYVLVIGIMVPRKQTTTFKIIVNMVS